MTRKQKPIVTKELVLKNIRTALYVVYWLSRRIREGGTAGRSLGIKPPQELKSQSARAQQSFVKKEWEFFSERWEAHWSAKDPSPAKARESYQQLVGELRSWIDKRLTGETRTQLRNAVRQHHYRQRHSKKTGGSCISIRVDRRNYEAATSGLPARQKAVIVARLLERFAKDESLRREILAG